LKHLPHDLLRQTFEALGVRLDVQFAPNTESGSRRRRVPIRQNSPETTHPRLKSQG